MKKEKQKDLLSLLAAYQDQWVALSADEKEIVAWDATFKGAVEKARKKGEAHPVLLKVPLESGGYLL